MSRGIDPESVNGEEVSRFEILLVSATNNVLLTNVYDISMHLVYSKLLWYYSLNGENLD